MKTEHDLGTDPFTRMTLIKCEYSETDTCAWCGNRDRYGRVWMYLYETAMGRRPLLGQYHDKRFCCVGCFRVYSL